MRQITKYFALDLTAQKTALLTSLTGNSVNQIFLKIRNRIAEENGLVNVGYLKHSQTNHSDDVLPLVVLTSTAQRISHGAVEVYSSIT